MTTVPYGRKVSAMALLEELAARQKTPVSAMLQLTQRCNFRCKHCYQTHARDRELTTRQWKAVMDDLSSSGVLFLTFSGGEPLLRRDFGELASHARSLRFALKLKTNGYRLDRKMADLLKRNAFLEVHLSLYSSRSKVHDAVTGVDGSHRKVMSAARMLVRRDVGVLMNVPLMNVNASEVDDIIAMCERETFGWAMDPHLNVCEDGRCNPRDLRMTDDQLVRVFSDPRIFDPEAVARTARKRSVQDRVCNAGRVSCVVSPTGDLLLCPLLPMSLGNLREASLADLWTNSPQRRRVESITWGDLDTCAHCDLLGWCVRCHGAALFEEGDMLGPSRVACQAARARRDACSE